MEPKPRTLPIPARTSKSSAQNYNNTRIPVQATKLPCHLESAAPSALLRFARAGPCSKHECVSFSAPETIVTAFAASVDHTDTNLRCKSALSLHRPITVISIDTAAAIPPTRPSEQHVILIQGVVKAFWRARGERNTHRKPGTNMAASLNKAVTFCSSTPPPFRGETPIVSCL